MRVPAVLHPFLFAAFPVLFLFSRNVEQTAVADVAGPLALALAAALAALLVTAVIVRDLRRAGLAVSVGVFAVAAYGHVLSLLEGQQVAGWEPAGSAWTLVAWLALAAGLIWAAGSARRHAGELTTILNGVAAVLVAMSLVPIGGHKAQAAWRASGDSTTTPATAALPGDGGGDEPRDIYFIILDRYGGERSLADYFDFDNRLFLDKLASRGFRVVETSYTNYPKTAHALAATLNMRYLGQLTELHGEASGDWMPLYDMLQAHEVGRLLTERGYTYYHIGSWWEPTGTNILADVNLRWQERSDFAAVLYDTTVLPTLADRLGVAEEQTWRHRHYEHALYQFDQLDRIRGEPGPKFVFAHILLPHEPYVFERAGSWVSAELEAARSRQRNFTEQLRYTNTRTEELVDTLLPDDQDEEDAPIVVLQADEGPHPLRYEADQGGYSWEEATLDELLEKFRVLNALFLPGVDDDGLYDGFTSINTFPYLFNRYFDTGLPMLPDEMHIFSDHRHLYRFTEVTDRLRQADGLPPAERGGQG